MQQAQFTETQPQFVLSLKAHVKVDWSDPEKYYIGEVEIPREVFYPASGQNLRLKEPWRLETGMSLPDGMDTLHYCIFSSDLDDKRRYWIPIDFVLLQPSNNGIRHF